MSVLLALLLTVPVPAVARPVPSPVPGDDPPTRLESWPEPADKKALRTDVQRLRKARTPEMEAGAREDLHAVGAAAAPELLRALGKEKDEAARGRLVTTLESVTDAPHTRLLAREFESRSLPVRIFALRRVAAFPDDGLAQQAGDALRTARETARKHGEKADPNELFAAALCAVSTGSLEGLVELRPAAVTRWTNDRDAFLRALAGIRGEPASRHVTAWLQSDDRDVRLGALRLLAGCCEPGHETALAPALDDPDPVVRTAAINALRAIVDGDPPLERLPVFEAIERAQRWKERLG